MHDLSILIVTRDRPDDLERCLASVFRPVNVSFEVVVVDNASSDARVAAVLRRYPGVRVVHLPRNYGDWEGRDIGRLQCDAPYILSLDDDAELSPGAAEELLEVARSNPNLAVVQPRVLEPLRRPGVVLGTPHDTSFPHLVGGFLGGACLLRAKALHEAGGFPHFWLGGAEPFLSLRFLDLGYDMVFWPGATIMHWASQANRVAWHRSYFASAGRIRAIVRNEPRVFHRLAHVFWKPLACSLACVRRRHFAAAMVSLLPLYAIGVKELFSRPLSNAQAIRRSFFLRKNVVAFTVRQCGWRQ